MPASALAGTPELFPHQDKVLHALTYGGFAALLGWAIPTRRENQPKAWLVEIVLLATAYGALMEGLQLSLVWMERDCSWGDLLANLVGAVLGIGIFVLGNSRGRLRTKPL